MKSNKVLRASAVFILLALASIASAQSPAQLYEEANHLYKKNDFDGAAAQFEKLLSQGFKEAEVHYNLGNCYYKTGQFGKAILNYERGLKLNPNDEDVQHNLKLANARIVDKIQPVPQLAVLKAWNDLVASRSSKGWSLFAIIFIWLGLTAYAVNFLFRIARRLILTIAPIFVAFSVIFTALAYVQNQSEEHSDEAILLASSIFVKSAPDVGGNDLFTLHEGVKFKVLDRVGDWNKIRLADGKIGWIDRSTFEKI